MDFSDLGKRVALVILVALVAGVAVAMGTYSVVLPHIPTVGGWEWLVALLVAVPVGTGAFSLAYGVLGLLVVTQSAQEMHDEMEAEMGDDSLDGVQVSDGFDSPNPNDLFGDE